jgi:hypothetical protein
VRETIIFLIFSYFPHDLGYFADLIDGRTGLNMILRFTAASRSVIGPASNSKLLQDVKSKKERLTTKHTKGTMSDEDITKISI